MKTLLSIVLFCLINFHKSIFAFVPSGRAEHNAVLIDKRLYFHGGARWRDGYAPDQLFYLDVSKSFTTYDISLMPWINLSSISGVSCKTGATACADETTIYYIGGNHCGGLVSKFDTISLQWSEPTTSGSIPTSTFERPGEEMKWVQCVILEHKIHIYGGFAAHKMNILDTSQLYWSSFTSSLIYSGTQYYSATLLNDSILYIGGTFRTLGPFYDSTLSGCQTNSNQELPISIFNTNDNTWRVVTTTGQIPTKKCNYASVYIPQHNRILLFYGADDVTINSLDTLTFTWTIPVILNSGGPLRRLMGHTTTLIGAYVLIAFGYYLTDDRTLISSDIFLLDVSHKDSYNWVTTYDPINSIQPIPTSPTSPTSPSNISIGAAIAGMIVCGIIGMIIGGVLIGLLRPFIDHINRVNYDRLQ
ncbi:galactose oxidase [Gigaspora margarita]|uniref:Galactose oxidase n=1 Tax=Gigaspora margarita TaxID=4874 RepID=A0A8H3X5F5_GIGMA|nr:galactose oxidase [Gigaspora margarita]